MRANLLTRQLLWAAFLIFALLAPALAQAEEIGGRYCGKLLSGGEFIDVVTILAPGRDGRLQGVYSFREGSVTVDGTLREERANGLTRTLVWTDKYGSGRLLVTFTSSYAAFRGAWGVDYNLPNSPWHGVRCSMGTVWDQGPNVNAS